MEKNDIDGFLFENCRVYNNWFFPENIDSIILEKNDELFEDEITKLSESKFFFDKENSLLLIKRFDRTDILSDSFNETAVLHPNFIEVRSSFFGNMIYPGNNKKKIRKPVEDDIIYTVNKYTGKIGSLDRIRSIARDTSTGNFAIEFEKYFNDPEVFFKENYICLSAEVW